MFLFEAFRRGDTHNIQLHGDRAVIIAKILASTGVLSKLYGYRDVGVMHVSCNNAVSNYQLQISFHKFSFYELAASFPNMFLSQLIKNSAGVK